MQKKELLSELEQEFKQLKDELKLAVTLDELDTIFFVRDAVLQLGYVPNGLSRMICSRITDLFSNWNGYLHNLVVPNPNSMIRMSEGGAFSDEDKKKIMDKMKCFQELISRNILVGLTKKRQDEGKFIQDSVALWSDNLDFLIDVVKRANTHWKE